MNPEERDWFEQAHRQAVEQYLEQEDRGLALTKQLHEKACERHRQEEERVRRLMEEAHRQRIEQHLATNGVSGGRCDECQATD